MPLTRRELGRLALAGLPAAVLLPGASRTAVAQSARPDSKWAGVQVGLNVPYNFGGRNMPNEEIIQRSVKLKVSALELRGQPIETFLGVPVMPAAAAAGPDEGAAGGLIELEQEVLRDAREVARKTFADNLRRWRSSVDLARLSALRRQYEDAGVLIEIVKWDDIAAMSDEEIDYCFRVAKALGAKAISTEISAAGPKRLAPFASKHQVMAGLHGHATTGAAEFESAFAAGALVGANLDIGHWVAGGHGSPLPFLEQHAARITHIHVKDRRLNNGPNTPFGQGDTPIREVLQAMRDRKWTFQATLEFEYPVPEGSDRMTEMAKALEYCRQCLVA